MSIRAFKRDDLPAIFRIYDSSKLDELKFEDTLFTLLPLENDKVRLNGLLESDIYVYEDLNCIVGYAAVYGKEIRALFVSSESRGKGVGKTLFVFSLSLIQEQAYLYVVRSNKRAKQLYQEHGFNVIDTFETTYNQEPVVAQKMVRTVLAPKQRG
ncbi:GNAT family N-acetyltransferase [Alginatibacterium sediminis]|uniref:GNAT family N-acetyltransferase n=1 Tax=Alginatibacterium sediminis TaxID=2164068 RepID=A0A420EGR5_9ALTE|nr:GNAT family N-acetyltransferase [Alginatibacterium sediminis]RKF19746.1 GNAT family N-acetyltransferase [Alginatibacterium sediminis]